MTGNCAEQLSERQETVLRALVRAYVAGAGPVGSTTLSHTLPVKLSSASIRTTMAELTTLGFIEQPHPSAGRVPTERGLRIFVDDLMEPNDVVSWERRRISAEMDDVSADASLETASLRLAERTRQLGFAMLPRLDRVVLQHVSLVRLSRERVLVVLVSALGTTYQRVIQAELPGEVLPELESELNRRLSGHTLVELRRLLEVERQRMANRAARLTHLTLLEAVRALTAEARVQGDVLISATPVLDQPEFRDPGRLRALLEALEARETLLGLLDRILERDSVLVTFGDEVELPGLRHCALVTAPCSAGDEAAGLVGVLGPSRMDFPRVIPLVELYSELVVEKLVS